MMIYVSELHPIFVVMKTTKITQVEEKNFLQTKAGNRQFTLLITVEKMEKD
jgi:hypothetical protein